ncbi:MAG: hypothetical protein JWL89_395 [Candidatus Saccharibacteria bacterium]|nr:hypothetical protein [Candidatus Saccharibacteria bacterium]
MTKVNQITLDKDKLLKQIESLVAIAKKDKWSLDYDTDTDEMTFGKKTMPRDTFLFNVNDELNLFLSPDSTINGIFIEYFAVNFIEHNKELEPVLQILEEETPTETPKMVAHAKKALEQELLADAFKSLFNRDNFVTAV